MHRLGARRALLRQRRFVGGLVGRELRLHLGIGGGRIALRACQRPPGQLRIDAAQGQAARLMLGTDTAQIGLRQGRIHAHQHLPGAHHFALAHQDFLDHAGLGGLHDLEIRGRYQLAIGHRDDIEPAQEAPCQDQGHEPQDRPQQLAAQRVGCGFLKTNQQRLEIAWVDVRACVQPGFEGRHHRGSPFAAQSSAASSLLIRPHEKRGERALRWRLCIIR